MPYIKKIEIYVIIPIFIFGNDEYSHVMHSGVMIIIIIINGI